MSLVGSGLNRVLADVAVRRSLCYLRAPIVRVEPALSPADQGRARGMRAVTTTAWREERIGRRIDADAEGRTGRRTARPGALGDWERAPTRSCRPSDRPTCHGITLPRAATLPETLRNVRHLTIAMGSSFGAGFFAQHCHASGRTMSAGEDLMAIERIGELRTPWWWRFVRNWHVRMWFETRQWR